MTPGELFTAASYLVGALVFLWAARQRRMSTEGIWLVVAVGFICGVAGAKLTQMIAEGWPTHLATTTALDPRYGGRALLGGVVFGWIGVELAKRKLGIRRSTGDLFALALPAGESVGRIGCYLNGCCYGERCDLPWAVYQHGAYRHPAQLYSAAVALVLFIVLVRIWKPLSPLGERGRGEGKGSLLGVPTREGDLFRLYLLGFGVSRFFLEFLRWRETLVLGLSPMQWFCLELIATVAIGQWWRMRKEVRAYS